MKTCTKCGLEKKFDQFYKDHRLSQGCSSHCKHCINKHRKAYYDPTKNRANKLMASFGITLDEYDALLEAQNGCCKICGTATPGHKGRFVVDHNHGTNEIRGLLCSGCNVGLGHFKDNPDNLQSASIYLLTNGHYGKTEKGN